VQSAAVLAVAQRRTTPRAGEVDRALWRDRTIVKTWAMRGTLHLLAPEDLPAVVGAMSTLHPWTAPSYEKYFGVTPRQVERVRDTIGEILADRVLTRSELGSEVSKRVRSTAVTERLGSGWGEMLKPAAFAGLLTQGPPRDGRVTYTRPDTWLGTTFEPLDAIDAGAELTRLYLRAHGPATAKDIASWWARQSVPKVRPWLARLGDDVVEIEVDGEPHLLLADDLDGLRRQRVNGDVRLLPIFDQYVLAAARDIEHLVPAGHRDEVFRKINGWIAATVVVGGRVVGTWDKDGSDVALNLWGKAPKRALDREVERVTALIRSAPETEEDR
jgi:hypothetical protein